MARTVPWSDRVSVRRLLSRHLAGDGLELGPGHEPFPIPFPGTSVRYVDRWEPDENRALFYELGDDVQFPQPDIVANLDVDGLSMIEDASQDFVIASHILEHMADPIRLLDDIARVTRPGGVAIILLPDRRRTFDRSREPTSLAHLLADHAVAPVAVDDAHVREFLAHTEPPERYAQLRSDPAAMADAIRWHRERSIHVHCWHEDEFAEVLHHCILERGHRWELVDGVLAGEEGPDGHEFGFVLRHPTQPMDQALLAERFLAAFGAWRLERSELLDAAVAAQQQAAASASAPLPGALRVIGRRVRAAARR